jgi:predicted dehydrogenase
MDPLRVGIIGVGNISGIYLDNLTAFPGTEVLACADLDLERAQAACQKYSVPLALTPDDLLAHPDIELVLNLTIPAAHGSVARAAIAAGKHVYNEKPLAISLEDGKAMEAEAAAKGVRVGCAPDTFLGAGQQLCRELIAKGAIGQPVGIQGFMLSGGVEMWHPNPEFYYKPGAGPLFDMGPYYLTAFVNLLGPIRRVTGAARINRAQRTITSQPFAGQVIDVETPTHIVGVLDFANGAIGDLSTSFDVAFAAPLPNIALYGTEGTILVPDPNTFGGPVKTKDRNSKEWIEHPIERPYSKNSRGLGVLELGLAAREGRPHRASGALALHVLETMHAVLASAKKGTHITLESNPPQPEALSATPFPGPELR